MLMPFSLHLCPDASVVKLWVHSFVNFCATAFREGSEHHEKVNSVMRSGLHDRLKMQLHINFRTFGLTFTE